MGNFLGKLVESDPRRSEIQFDFFSRHYNAHQYPKNLYYPLDNELYSINCKETGKPFILKRVTFYSQETLHSFLNSLENATEILHDNILKIENYFIERNLIREGIVSHSVNIIMENFTHTLKDELYARKATQNPFSEAEIKTLLIELIDALKNLHQSNYAHGSICPSNIFITEDNKFKLCFLGETIYRTESGINPNLFNMIEYMPPKLRANLTSTLINENFSFKIMSDKYKGDIFSLGLVLLHMLSFQDVRNLNVSGAEPLRLARLHEHKDKLPLKLIDLIELMLQENESSVPNYSDVKGIIQIHHDEESGSNATHIMAKSPIDSSVIPITQPQNWKQLIEMKLIEDRSGDRVSFNYPFEASMSEDIIDDYSARYLGKKTPYGESMEFPGSYEDFSTRLQYDVVTKSTTSLSDDCLHSKKYDEDRQNHEDFVNKGNKSPVFRLAADEMLISKEEDLLKPMNPLIKKLVIRLGGQSQNENCGKVLGHFLSQQRALQELALTLPNMSIGDQGIVAILHGMTGMDNLSVLYLELRKNKVSTEGVRALGKMLNDKKMLVQLGIDLAGNSLAMEGCKELASALEGLENVKSLALNIGGNQVGCDGLEDIIKPLYNLKSLESFVLYVYSNKIEKAKILSALLENIDGMENLKSFSVDLSDNLIGDEAAEAILNFLKGSTLNYISVELMNNCIPEAMRERMIKETAKNTNIKLKV